MSRIAAYRALVAGFLAAVAAAPAAAAPTVPQMLTFKPRQQEVVLSTPTPDEYAACEVKLISGRPGTSGWLLVDAQKRPMRRFFDSNGDKKIDQWSYFKDGAEVYREIDTNANDRPDQYRWLNAGGMKWGVDTDEDGKIDAWRMISAEEVGQEAFQALATRDFARLQALFLSEAEMKALKLPEDKIARLLSQQKQAQATFQSVAGKANLDRAHFLRLEGGVPHCVPADSFGGEQDLLKFTGRSILYETADKKHDWLVTGEMIQVGLAWRLTDVPGHHEEAAGPAVAGNPELQKLLEQLSTLDKSAPSPLATPGKNDAVAAYNLQRVALVEKILPLVKAEDRENWIKQLADNLGAAFQAGNEAALTRLTGLKDQVAQAAPAGTLTGYVTFREMWSQFAPKLSGAARVENLAKVQEEWLERLAKFVQAFPRAEDTPDALHQLAMGSEFAGKDEEAKRWYQQIHKNFPEHYLAEKARGAERRLDLVGKELELSGPQLGTGTAFDVAQMKGKVVVVYWWASYVNVCLRDFAQLKQLQSTYAAKGIELVCVSLDDRAEDATKFLQTNPIPGVHLYQQPKDGSGLSSPLGLRYGINGLPTLFLVGRDGRVISRTLQVGDLEEALKKAL